MADYEEIRLNEEDAETISLYLESAEQAATLIFRLGAFEITGDEKESIAAIGLIKFIVRTLESRVEENIEDEKEKIAAELKRLEEAHAEFATGAQIAEIFRGQNPPPDARLN